MEKGLLGGGENRSTEPRIIADMPAWLEAVGWTWEAGDPAGEQGGVAGEELHEIDAAALVGAEVAAQQFDQRAHGRGQAVLRIEVAQQVDDLPVRLFVRDIGTGGQLDGYLHTPVVQMPQIAVLVQGDGAMIGQDEVTHSAHDQLTDRAQRQARATKPAWSTRRIRESRLSASNPRACRSSASAYIS